MDMTGTPNMPASPDARPLEVKDDAYSGLLAKVRGSPDARAMRASRSSRDGGGNKSHSESVLTVHGSSDLGMATGKMGSSRAVRVKAVKSMSVASVSPESDPSAASPPVSSSCPSGS
eukprot:573424-Pleurochrysis_carterae.AAC.1